MAACTGMRAADQVCDRRREPVDDEAGQDAGDEAERGEGEHGGERQAIDLVRRRPRAGCAAGRGRSTPKAGRSRRRRAPPTTPAVAPTAGTMNLSAHCGSSGLRRIAWKISHSETKPLSGGSAEIATQPTRKTKAVCGMRWIRPPSCSMSRSPVAVSTAPAPKNSRLLNSEWLRTWNSAAVSASAAAAGMPLALKASARPRPTKMMPIFSIVQ